MDVAVAIYKSELVKLMTKDKDKFLMFGYELKEQVQRSFEDGCLDIERHGLREDMPRSALKRVFGGWSAATRTAHDRLSMDSGRSP